MLILSLDTTTAAGSCAVTRDRTVVRERAGDASRSHAARLPGELMVLLADAGVTLPDIDVFAVASGPGSFTGLRVGIAAMQGLAFAAGKPLIGISALDALASSVEAPHVVTWMDAWRGEVYSARYAHGLALDRPIVALPEQVLLTLEARDTVFVGDGAGTYRDLIVATLGSHAHVIEPAAPPIAAAIARQAAGLVAAGHRPPPDAIRPLYVRRPDAEIARDRDAAPPRAEAP